MDLTFLEDCSPRVVEDQLVMRIRIQSILQRQTTIGGADDIAEDFFSHIDVGEGVIVRGLPLTQAIQTFEGSLLQY